MKPLHELSVVELALGVSELGLGMAGGVPGMILADLGARVTRIVDPEPPAIDRDVAWGRAWHRAKEVVRSSDLERVRTLLAGADVALVYGSEALVEQRGLSFAALAKPKLVYARCRPSRTSRGTVADYGLLVEAQSGLCTQLQGHREGPIFLDARSAGAGTSFLLTSGVLALLRRRALSGEGGWFDTSLYDGMLATIGTMIGRAQHAPEHVEGYWEKGSTFPNFMYRCADGELIQIWFGGKGMYMKLIGVLGDEVASEGYYADQVSGALQARAQRWKARFTEQPRAFWMERLRAAGVACEPVLSPGDVLSDPHLKEVGLAVACDGNTFVRSAIDVAELGTSGREAPVRGGLLAGVRVLDFSAFVAGPLGAQVLADLGADVIKVEPPEGEAMRAATYALAACHRGKRSIAIDITAPASRPVVERLIRWADVVLHNFRVGVSSRLGIDEDSVAKLNPRAVYCHASAFGTSGRRALFPGNDALMQALTGFEQAMGGPGNDPLAATWIPIDIAGGWLSAIGMLAGLYARAKSARGQRVTTSLLGAGMLLQSGVFQRGSDVVRQPELDRAQTGYGPGYRLYACADQFVAVVIPDASAWKALREFVELPPDYVPIRRGPDDREALHAEEVLQTAFASASASTWCMRLRALGVLVERCEPLDRDAFRRRIIDDPLNQQLGRVTAYQAFSWGRFEQLGSLLRCGPDAVGETPQRLPDIGEHSREVLAELGVEAAQVDALLSAKVLRQP